MVQDPRVRPCGAVVDPAGVSLERARIAWMSPDSENERKTLDAWCRTVGPMVVDQTRHGDSGRADRLVIVGWNVHLGAGDVAQLVGDLRGGRIGGVPADAPLVLLLQETFRSGDLVPVAAAGLPAPRRLAPHGPSPRRGALEIATMLGLNLYYVPAMRNGRGDGPDPREDRGLAILSSVPLSDLQAIELPFEHQRRPAAAATIQLRTSLDDVFALRLVNVHLESRSGVRRLWVASPHARNRQGTALAAALGDSVPTLIVGDLNTWGNREPVLDRLGRSFTACTDRRPTFSGGLRLDWFFSRLPPTWTLTCRRLDGKYGSDHYPIVGVLENDAPVVRRPKL